MSVGANPLDRATRVRERLFVDADRSVYAVLDGASVPGLLERLAAGPEEHACLYQGQVGQDLLERAPWLVKLRGDGPLLPWILSEGWGHSWGVFCVTAAAFEPLRRHFRGFLRVRGPAGQVLYFRYYDPRVLRVYLPTCRGVELGTVYGPIDRYACEGEDAGTLVEFINHPRRAEVRTIPV